MLEQVTVSPLVRGGYLDLRRTIMPVPADSQIREFYEVPDEKDIETVLDDIFDSDDEMELLYDFSDDDRD